MFIAAINGAVDSKLTSNGSKEDEPPFVYRYSVSFYCAVISFLLQELNGICNIYWYMGCYRKLKFQKLSPGQTTANTSSSKLSSLSRELQVKEHSQLLNENTCTRPTAPTIKIIQNNNPEHKQYSIKPIIKSEHSKTSHVSNRERKSSIIIQRPDKNSFKKMSNQTKIQMSALGSSNSSTSSSSSSTPVSSPTVPPKLSYRTSPNAYKKGCSPTANLKMLINNNS